ncbi:MAG: Spy/CpxP family protein refolding chaperone [Candidatus Sulfotelmatobacter sp.]
MMKAPRFRFLVAALCVLFVTVAARSQADDAAPAPPAPGHEFGRGGSGEFFADYLNLTDAQTAQMKGILAKENPALKPLFQQLQQTRQQLKQYEQGTYDDAKVRALATQQSAAMVELMVQQTRIHSELFQVLTPDQQATMKAVQARRAARMSRHMHEPLAAPAPEEQ